MHCPSLISPNCFPQCFMLILSVCSFSPDQIPSLSVLQCFYGSSLVTVLLEKRWLQAMTCDFQGRGEQGNFKQHGLPLGAVPFRALVSIMTSPIYLFTLGKPSMLPSGLVAGKFPVPATAQRSFSQGSGTLHCLFLSQPAASGPKLHGTGSLRKMCSLSLWHLCCIWHPPAGAEEHGEQ